MEPEALKAVNDFLPAGKSCPFSLHESAGTVSSFMVFLLIPYIMRLCWFLKLLFMKPGHNKTFLVA